MRVGIIDLGTNSVRFAVHRLGGKGKSKSLHREKLMVRLGQGAFLQGRLDRAAISRTLHAFSRFKRVATRLKVDKMIAYGTSALREVADREKFIEQVRAKTGIELRAISGEEEAKFIALGVLANEKLPKGRFALVDIGGGSTEISICRGKTVLHAFSFPLGTARLQQIFLRKSPPDLQKKAEMRAFIRNTIQQERLASGWPKVTRVMGSSGTIRAIGRILQLNPENTQIERAPLAKLNAAMARMTTTELLGISGMEARRVDMILAGAVLFEEILGVLGAKKAVCTEYSLRDGLLEEERRLLKRHTKSHLALHLADLREKAVAFGADPRHLERTEALSADLFRKLRPVHRLGLEWLPYLQAAAVLRDVGEFISLSQHVKHSAYIVKNSDLAPLEKWEIELLAELCLRHQENRVAPADRPFPKNRARREVFMKLLALLQVVDALDSGSETRLRLVSSRASKRRVDLRITGARLTGMEALQLEMRSAIFTQVFGRIIRAERV